MRVGQCSSGLTWSMHTLSSRISAFYLSSQPLVDQLFMIVETHSSSWRLGELGYDPRTAAVAVGGAHPRLAVLCDIVALRTIGRETKVVKICPVDAQPADLWLLPDLGSGELFGGLLKADFSRPRALH